MALALLAGLGGVLFAWLGQSLRDVSRLESAQQRAELQMQALALAATVNPATEAEGERRMAGVEIRWTSELLSPVRLSVPTDPMSVSRWRVGLYRMKVQVRGATPEDVLSFEMEQQGQLGLEADASANRLQDAP